MGRASDASALRESFVRTALTHLSNLQSSTDDSTLAEQFTKRLVNQLRSYLSVPEVLTFIRALQHCSVSQVFESRGVIRCFIVPDRVFRIAQRQYLRLPVRRAFRDDVEARCPGWHHCR